MRMSVGIHIPKFFYILDIAEYKNFQNKYFWKYFWIQKYILKTCLEFFLYFKFNILEIIF